MRHHASTALLWGSLLVAVLLAALVLSGRVGADLPTPLTDELALARLCVNESGLRAYTFDDCIGIDAVIRFRAEHIYRTGYVEALHRYSRRAVVERRHRGRPWIVDLWPDRREPAGYCVTCRWDGRGAVEWARTYQHAVEIRRGEHASPWAVHTWAAPGVVPADETAQRVDIGDTINDFWSVPAYLARWGV